MSGNLSFIVMPTQSRSRAKAGVGIHVFICSAASGQQHKTWMAGPSPAMTLTDQHLCTDFQSA
jgi:hypothetical protein